MSVDLRTPWRIDPTKYGAMVDCDGNRVCMAFTRQDADAIVAAVNATHAKPRCSACDDSGYTEEPDEDEHGGMCRSLSWVPCRECAKPMTPTPANDPEPDVCSSCAEAGELSGDSGGFGVETIGGGTEWFGTLDEAWSAMGPGRRVVTHG